MEFETLNAMETAIIVGGSITASIVILGIFFAKKGIKLNGSKGLLALLLGAIGTAGAIIAMKGFVSGLMAGSALSVMATLTSVVALTYIFASSITATEERSEAPQDATTQ